MPADPPHHLDPRRLAILEQVRLLDAVPDAAFDRLTRFATRLLGVPVALVTLVGRDRQVFRGCTGLPDPWATGRETPFSHSFCRHVVDSQAPLVVEDAREHPVLRHNLAIPDLGVVSYAGVPLRTADGQVLGSFCAIDSTPRRWTPDDVQTLAELAESAVAEIEWRRQVVERDDADALHRSIVSSARDAILVVDGRGVLRTWNDGARAMFGHADMVGRPMRDLLPPRFHARYDDALARHAAGLPSTLTGRVVEAEGLRADGTEFGIELSVTPWHADGEPLFTGIVRDVSQRKQAESDYRGLFEHAHDAIVIFTPEQRVLDANPRACELYGYAREEFIGRSMDDVSSDVPYGRQRVRETLARGVAYSFELEQRRRDGTPIFVEVTASVVEYAGETAILSINRDVTERHHAEERVHRSERELSRAQSLARIGSWTLDPATGRMTWSDELFRIVGFAPGAFEPDVDHSLRWVHPDDRPRVEPRFRGEVDWDALEYRIVRPDGATRVLEVRREAVGEPGTPGYRVIGTAQDVTEERQADAALQESEERFRQLAESVPDVFYLTALPDGHVTYVSPAYEEVWGRGPEDLLAGAARWPEAVHPDDRARVAAWAAWAAEDGRRGIEYRIVRPDGEVRWILDRTFPIRGEPGAHRAAGLAKDITERRHNEEALRASEGQLRAIFDDAAIGIALVDVNGRAVRTNRAMQRMFGFTPEELETVYISTHVHPDDMAADWELFGDLIAGERDHYLIEKRYYASDGRLVWGRLAASVVKGDDGAPRYVIRMVENITEQKVAEEALELSQQQFLQAQKMEAVGRLAGGVAHDFNNLLTVILGNTELLLMELPPDGPGSEVRYELEEIRDVGRRAAELTRQLLAFSRKQVMRTQTLDLNEVVAGTDRLLRRLLGEDVSLRAELSPAAGYVLADPGQLEQVLVNLAVNARDAMPRGGELALRTCAVDVPAGPGPWSGRVAPGRWSMLSVSDTGTGMDAETITRAFEPFFTTKGPGRGTGLGLATVYGIVQQSGGVILVDSQVGSGTTFRVFLPRVEGEAAEDEAPAPEAPGGAETVLVVEVDDGVRQVAARMLARAGYDVLEAGGAEDALRIAGDAEARIDLLLCDVRMPAPGGPEVAREIAALRPGLPVVFTSGYAEDAEESPEVGAAQGFVDKPFTPETLLARVRDALDGATA